MNGADEEGRRTKLEKEKEEWPYAGGVETPRMLDCGWVRILDCGRTWRSLVNRYVMLARYLK